MDGEVSALDGTPAFQGPYETVDLGISGAAIDVNNRGQVAIVSTIGRSHVWFRGTSQDIGTLGGAKVAIKTLNARGQVNGHAQIADGSWRQFLWTDGVMLDLGPAFVPSTGIPAFPSVLPQQAPTLNDVGEVVWTAREDSTLHSKLWRNGTVQDLGSLGGTMSDAVAINNAGQVAGLSTVPGDSRTHVYLWENGAMRDLGADLGRGIRVRDINDRGHVVVQSTMPDFNERMLLWDGTELRDITVGGFNWPVAINEQSQVAATRVPGHGWDFGQPFVWDNGAARTLQGSGAAIAINQSGVVAGHSNHPNLSATTVWAGDSTWQLAPNPRAPNFSQATDINDHGDVAGVLNGRATLWRRIHPVVIDVKPGDDSSRTLTNGGRGVTPVALLSSVNFAARDVDASTVVFAGAPSTRFIDEDVNGDGLMDVVHFFDSTALQLPGGATTACLRAVSLTGATLRGCDAIRTN